MKETNRFLCFHTENNAKNLPVELFFAVFHKSYLIDHLGHPGFDDTYKNIRTKKLFPQFKKIDWHFDARSRLDF